MNHKEILKDIRKILRAVHLESKRLQKEYGVSIPQLLCLHYLQANKDQSATHKELTKALDLNPSTVTGILERLEKKFFLEKIPSDTDRRTATIRLTSKGAEILEAMPPLFHERLQTQLDGLSDSRRRQLGESLKLLVDLLNIESFDAAPIISADEAK